MDSKMKELWVIVYFEEAFPDYQFEICNESEIVESKYGRLREGMFVAVISGSCRCHGTISHISEDHDYLEQNFKSLQSDYLKRAKDKTTPKVPSPTKRPCYFAKVDVIRIIDKWTQTKNHESHELQKMKGKYQTLKSECDHIEDTLLDIRGDVGELLDKIDNCIQHRKQSCNLTLSTSNTGNTSLASINKSTPLTSKCGDTPSSSGSESTPSASNTRRKINPKIAKATRNETSIQGRNSLSPKKKILDEDSDVISFPSQNTDKGTQTESPESHELLEMKKKYQALKFTYAHMADTLADIYEDMNKFLDKVSNCKETSSGSTTNQRTHYDDSDNASTSAASSSGTASTAKTTSVTRNETPCQKGKILVSKKRMLDDDSDASTPEFKSTNKTHAKTSLGKRPCRLAKSEPNSENTNPEPTSPSGNAVDAQQKNILQPKEEIPDETYVGGRRVPRSVLQSINWSSHSNATRKLLMTAFTRETLATYCMTGNNSPAFPDKPAKKQLDPVIIADIIKIVTEKCGVTPTSVRAAITTKCADENKMLRKRMENGKENTPGKSC